VVNFYLLISDNVQAIRYPRLLADFAYVLHYSLRCHDEEANQTYDQA
jgi:hypothetical protein